MSNKTGRQAHPFREDNSCQEVAESITHGNPGQHSDGANLQVIARMRERQELAEGPGQVRGDVQQCLAPPGHHRDADEADLHTSGA